MRIKLRSNLIYRERQQTHNETLEQPDRAHSPTKPDSD
jgi:hypothetical protein